MLDNRDAQSPNTIAVELEKRYLHRFLSNLHSSMHIKLKFFFKYVYKA